MAERGVAHAMFATGNSQLAFVDALVHATPDVPWSDVVVFHMDEYVGVGPDHPAGFQRWIRERIVEPARPRAAHYLDGRAEPGGEAGRYADLLRQHPLDLCCLGIGENGHLAFNDPPVADFDDPLAVKVVELEAACRRQQVNEGHFAALDEVPREAVTVTIPALLAAATVLAIVPEARKAEPVLGPSPARCPPPVRRRSCGPSRTWPCTSTPGRPAASGGRDHRRRRRHGRPRGRHGRLRLPPAPPVATGVTVAAGSDHACVVPGSPGPTVAWSRLVNPILSEPRAGVKDQALIWPGGRWHLLFSDVTADRRPPGGRPLGHRQRHQHRSPALVVARPVAPAARGRGGGVARHRPQPVRDLRRHLRLGSGRGRRRSTQALLPDLDQPGDLVGPPSPGRGASAPAPATA